MSKGNNILQKILENQKGKIFKNSECEICNCYLCEVKLKEHPTTKEMIIVCFDCWSEIVKGK